MKVHIFSWFKSGNIGDLLIAQRSKDLFKNTFDCSFYDINSGESTSNGQLQINQRSHSLKSIVLSNRFFSSLINFVFCFRNNVVSHFRQLDNEDCKLVVFFGGNTLMDLGLFFPGESLLIYRRIKELKKRGFQIAFCFCGVGPFMNKASKRLFKKSLKLIDFLSVRDEESLRLCDKYGKNLNVEIWRDPVLLMPSPVKTKRGKTIVINVYFGPDLKHRESMKKSYLWLVSFLRERYPLFHIVLFASETGDRDDVSTVYESFLEDSFIEVREINSPEDLFNMYEYCSLMIGCRMHSLITAIISGISVVAIGWQKKVFSLMRYLGYNDRIISKDDFCKSVPQIIEIVEKAVEIDEEALSRINKKIDQEREFISKRIEAFSKRWENCF